MLKIKKKKYIFLLNSMDKLTHYVGDKMPKETNSYYLSTKSIEWLHFLLTKVPVICFRIGITGTPGEIIYVRYANGSLSIEKLSSRAFQRYMTTLYGHAIYRWKALEVSFSMVCPTQRYANVSLRICSRRPWYKHINSKVSEITCLFNTQS